MTLTLALLLATSAGVLVDPFAHPSKMVVDAQATPAQAWRALGLVAKNDPVMKAQLDALVPLLPLVSGTGHARTITSSFERALRDVGAVPMNADPARRRGVLEVVLALKAADLSQVQAGRGTWILEARATLTSRDPKAARTSVVVRTRVAGADPAQAAAEGEEACAEALAKALVAEISRGVSATGPVLVTSTPRIVAATAALRQQADDSRRARAVLAAFPAQLLVDVEAGGESQAWSEAMRARLVDVAQDALPLTLSERDYQLRAKVSVHERAGQGLAGDAVRTWTLRTTLVLTTGDGRALVEVTRLVEATGTSPAEAAADSAEKAARAAYDGLVDEVVAKVERLGRSRAAR